MRHSFENLGVERIRWNRMEKDAGTSAKGITAATLTIVLSMGDSALTCVAKCSVVTVST